MSIRTWRCSTAGLAAACAAQSGLAHPPVRSLGVLPGYTTSRALAVSSYGEIVVGECVGGVSSASTRAFWWTLEHGMQPIPGAPTLVPASARAMSELQVVVGTTTTGGGFKFIPGSTASEGLPLAGSGFAAPFANGIGVVVGDLFTPPQSHAPFRWSAETGYTVLPPASSGQGAGVALGVSEDGLMVVGRFANSLTGGGEAFLWTQTAGTMGLGWLSAASQGVADSTATAIASSRVVIVGYSTGGQRALSAFRYTPESGMVDLGALPGAIESRACAVDKFGAIIVGDCTYPDGHHTAFIWDQARGMRDLRHVLLAAGSPIPLDWTLETALGVGGTGSAIVGTGRDPSGQPVAYLARVFSCYANFDSSTTPPVLNVADFGSFLNAFAAGHLRANCDNSYEEPILTVNDFACYMDKFASGCGSP